ncbi:MAG: hypothetical protein JWR21_1906 [Herminiimonas sp.]|nr:hypothetical protein [Herminiimonas sp.]MDB5854887.1 hypothetical protein [Herminiimonas sp.]
MSTYAIEAVHLNEQNGRIEQVMWAKVDPVKNRWDTDPIVAHVDEVINCLQHGDEVWTAFPVGHYTVLGPRIEVVQSDMPASLGAWIDTVDAESHPGRSLLDMPMF